MKFEDLKAVCGSTETRAVTQHINKSWSNEILDFIIMLYISVCDTAVVRTKC